MQREEERDICPLNNTGFNCGGPLIYMDFIFFLRFYLFVFREGKGKRKGEKHQCMVASCVPPTGNLACNPGTHRAWESNPRSFGSQSSTRSTEPPDRATWTFF